MNVKGLLAVTSNLEVKSQLFVKGPAYIGEFFRGYRFIAKLNSSCKVVKMIEGGTIEINGFLKAESISVENLVVNGSVDVKGNICASNDIRVDIRHASNLKVGGVIKAPLIRFTNSKAQKRFWGLYRTKPRPSRVIAIEGLKIQAEILVLEGVNISGDIQADHIITRF
jgi:hypothetical protein